MKTELTNEEMAELLPHIKRVLETGKSWCGVKCHYPACAIINAILSIKGMAKHEGDDDAPEGFSTNGWQWDWWQEFVYKRKRYTLSGSGYHGGHAFHLSDSN